MLMIVFLVKFVSYNDCGKEDNDGVEIYKN